jgi:hypothetical protein
MSGVYIILNASKSNSDKLYVKIGCSKNVDNRIKQISKSFRFNGNLDELTVLQTIPCTQYKRLEKTLHTALKAYRCVGEWFEVSEDKLNERLMMIELLRYV